MNKKLMIIIASIFFIFSYGSAYGLTLTLDTAKSYLKNNPDYIKTQISYEKANLSYNESTYDYSDAISALNLANENATVDDEAPYKAYTQLVSAQEKKDDAQDSLDEAERNLADFEYELDYLLEQKYAALLALERSYESAQIKYELEKTSNQVNQLRYNKGMINKEDYNNSISSFLSSQQNVLDATEKYIQGKKDFCFFLGIDYTEDITLENFVTEEFIISDKETLLSRAQSNYYTYTIYAEELDDLRDEYDYENDYYTRENLGYSLTIKELDYQKTQLDFEKTISNLYKDYEKELLSFEMAKMDYENELKNYNFQKYMLEKGLISNNSFRLIEEEFKNKENSYLQSSYDKYFIEYRIKLAEKGILVN